MTIKYSVPMATHSFFSSPHPLDFNTLVIFSLKNVKQRHKLLLDHAYEVLLANIKMECQRWPEKLLIWGRSGTQYDAMVTELLSSYCGEHLVESYCKKSKISDANWLRYLFSSYLNKIWLSV